ncbi:AraC family transcriptional regulator [Streptomyces alkaliterrae]|uniref:AraC family transcriptional regulator n=1 Tax=Streptomyces alkaliterrae TaxID=2213162 RepID=A0A5P0YQL6_9ACTN|nr:AraC family transcriptional regulator [Streptomyces alkaliterrae]MBB1252580.1 AraC family transcriptional regulator [Streptomyces alkaliterrae]MBB1258584.1 AraC family transcriptional regulator [Streptomyces alkaliterrae]MQS00829.1 helix-turn-helix domain-containing protein [Streptomyces alkaliterrae]
MELPSTDPSAGEWARHWQDDRLPGIDLLRAHYVRQSFPRHAHEGYTLCAITSGVEEVGLPDGVQRVGDGGVVMINPEVAHTARAGTPQGWTYATLYPTAELVHGVAAETTTLRGTPAFTEQAVVDPLAGRLIHAVHQAAEAGNALAADGLLRTVLARLLHRHGGVLPARPIRSAGALRADAARRILTERLADPPALAELAEELGTSPFALSRAFRERHGQPPHGWLTDARVRAARRLLEAGTPPAEAATAVGFTDQAHLGRHFRRIVGVPPGAYQRERLPRAGARTYKTRTTPTP